jgi:hypothetical protein
MKGTLLLLLTSAALSAQFEVASIKPCKSDPQQGQGRIDGSQGRIRIACVTVDALVRNAYVLYPGVTVWRIDNLRTGIPNPPYSPAATYREIKGPAWTRTERFSIDAKAETPATLEAMRGPMMRTLLRDRFHLKVSSETKDVRVMRSSPPAAQPNWR